MHYKNVVKWAERRIKPRHKAHCLKVNLRSSGLLGLFRASLKTSCIDFNRYGMAVESEHAFRPKERIVLEFRGKYICQSNVEGIVQDCKLVGDVYRISVVFSYALSPKNYSRKIDNALSRIELIYNEERVKEQGAYARHKHAS